MSGVRQRSGTGGSGQRRFAAWLAVFGLLANLLVPVLGVPPAQAASAAASVFADDSICHANGEQPQPKGGHHGLGDACSLCLLLGHGGAFVAADVIVFAAAGNAAAGDSAILVAQAAPAVGTAPLGSRAPPALS